jgi:predicted O-methyltransferase YrrM
MSYETWSEVDEFIAQTLLGEDAVLAEALARSEAAGLPRIAVSPPQGKFLALLARIHRARRILELGTLGGYSTIWMGRALAPGGRLVTLELDPGYAKVAGESIAAAGLADVVEQRVGPAADSLRALIAEQVEPFDLIFIDADKPSTPEYFTLSMQLVRPGGIILTDNVVRDGRLADPSGSEPGAAGMRRFHELLAAEQAAGRVSGTTIQTVGVKGYDGFTLAVVGEPA